MISQTVIPKSQQSAKKGGELRDFIREPIITRFQSISCRNQISINFVWFCDEIMSAFFEDYGFCFRTYRYSISRLSETVYFVGATKVLLYFLNKTII